MSELDATESLIPRLRRLTPAELAVLRRRCEGMTAQETASAFSTTEQTARYLLGNIYDKLGITYDDGVGTSLSRLMEYCPLLADPSISQIGSPASLENEPLPLEPSGRALLLVAQDDQALLAQRTPTPEADSSGNNRQLLYLLGGALAVAVIGGLIYLLMSDDDGDDAAAAATQTATISTTATVAPEATTSTGGSVTEPAATLAPSPTPEPSPTLEPAATDVPPEATGVPQPLQGEVVYQADWSTGPGDWVLPDGWTAQSGTLAGDGATAGSILAPFQSDQPRYAVEADIVIDGTPSCDELAGVIARAANGDGVLTAGYAGAVCTDEWLILAVRERSDVPDELASGEIEPITGQHTYRLEVDGERLRFFIDAVFAGETEDVRWADPGSAGLFLDGDLRVTVAGFRVYSLPETP